VLSTELRCYYASIGYLMLLDQLAVHIKDRRVLKISLAISGEQHSEAARCAEQNLDSIPMAGGAFPAWLSRASKAPAYQ
jgi:hypothetical protein